MFYKDGTSFKANVWFIKMYEVRKLILTKVMDFIDLRHWDRLSENLEIRSPSHENEIDFKKIMILIKSMILVQYFNDLFQELPRLLKN